MSEQSSIVLAVVMVGAALFSQQARAQNGLADSLPNSTTVADGAVQPDDALSAPAVIPPHAFWDRTNLLLFSGIAGIRGLDYASTRNFQARGRQEILLPDDVVNNSAGFASLEAAATATSIGISYVLHRTGHHTLERWMSIGHISVTSFGVVRNYSLESRHRPPPER